jgi:hypothetical protein
MGDIIELEPIINAHKELAELEPRLNKLLDEIVLALIRKASGLSLWAYYLHEWNKLSDRVVDLLMEVDDLERHSTWQRCNDLSNSFLPLLEREKWIG